MEKYFSSKGSQEYLVGYKMATALYGTVLGTSLATDGFNWVGKSLN